MMQRAWISAWPCANPVAAETPLHVARPVSSKARTDPFCPHWAQATSAWCYSRDGKFLQPRSKDYLRHGKMLKVRRAMTMSPLSPIWITQNDCALPERWVTVHSGHMGYTLGLLRGEQKCPGGSVTHVSGTDPLDNSFGTRLSPMS